MLLKSMRWATLPLKTQFLKYACKRISSKPIGTPPGKFDITLLMMAWGNLGYAAGGSYLGHVGRRVAGIRGPILECGSGATTLLMAALTKSQDNEIIVLEHNREWFRYMRSILKQLDFAHVRLIHAPLARYGHYEWYKVSPDKLSSEISLVVCDGPPGSIQGGRYGLMPVMQSKLASQCTILLDDTHREAERRIIDAWKVYRTFNTHRLGRFGSHSELICLS